MDLRSSGKTMFHTHATEPEEALPFLLQTAGSAFYEDLSSKLSQVVTSVTCIWEVHGSNLGQDIYYPVGFEVLAAVFMKSTIFWDITPRSPLSVNRRIGGKLRLHLQGRKNKLSKKPP
jgi:hypothetical protein